MSATGSPSLTLVNSSVTGNGTIEGVLNTQLGGFLGGAYTGSGIVVISNGSIIPSVASFTGPTLSKPAVGNGTLYYYDCDITNVQCSTVSEQVTGSGVTVDGVKCKDSKVITAVTNVTGTTYTTLATDNVVLVDDDTAGAAVTVTLLAAATAGDGHRIDIKKLGSTGNVVIDANGAELIDGALTQTLTTQYENITLICDGSSWHIL